ncbi:drug/metabolite transporter (DMT)-like permease [Pelomonas saccharophila]|uniref:Drug/metabolite transporter (DMT)-like permease n=1 Tax=Roseateles saccharophilus TaxID=304 RepID=A0ABU1YQ83_ROSSA|nr:DMT family transporter [Roseateles saccharophilus]MDR7271020.1 drug/metabolite transporter (DMT)-like permease [Roseateles saccharophilus]
MNAFLYLLVVLIWGTTWIALKWQLGPVPIALSIAYRFGLAAIVLFAWLAWRRQLVVPRGKALTWVLAQGLCLFCLNFVCFLNASQTVASGLVAVVFSSAALWNALLARVVHGRAIAPQVLAGGALGLAGLMLLFWPEIRGGHASAAGLAWALGGTLCFSTGNLLSAALQGQGLKPVQTNAWGMAVGTSLLTAYALLAGVPFVFDASARYVGALLYLAIPGSVIGFTAYLTLVGRLGPERAAYSTVLFPVVALNVSAWVEGYQWTAPALVGLLLVMAGNVLVFRKPAASRTAPSPRPPARA